MSITIAMPQLGLTMTEGTVSSWQKQIGERVQKDEILLVVSTDKVDMDVEAPEDGTLVSIQVESGVTVPVGTPLAYLKRPGEEVDVIAALEEDDPREVTSSQEKNEASEASGAAVASVPTAVTDPFSSKRLSDRIVASPRAKRLASEFKIDLADLRGSGPQGRIHAEDVQMASSKGQAPGLRTVTSPALPTASSLGVSATPEGDVRRRQIIADRMVESITTIPAFSVSLEVDAENLVSLYEGLREPLQREAGVKLTYTDLLLKALASAAARTPEIRATWDRGSLQQSAELGIGMAIATDRGVVAPVLVAVDGMNLDEIARRRAEMTEKARRGRLALEDLGGASGTLSNLGMYRVDHFQGIITPGQTYILAVGALRKRPWAEGTEVVIRSTLILNLSVDHRVADGATAARFLERIADSIERPYQLLWTGTKGK